MLPDVFTSSFRVRMPSELKMGLIGKLVSEPEELRPRTRSLEELRKIDTEMSKEVVL